ncbi:hypothetical protein [Phytohabitans houttuyneae]|uniref:Uncharacterized protein n=1 Tax=Phytohabitans houttuyneae TaxID=1076126 RepID=A0A6V8KPA0_9ACTN|nr:hypothetical protein [Phytohabitans houttuyneae]GFJ84438.1 hypothetical protein Phou_086180 [Phytohabitans houttuyneae]
MDLDLTIITTTEVVMAVTTSRSGGRGRVAPRRARRAWTRPEVRCLETRPEVTAYSGDTGPWL